MLLIMPCTTNSAGGGTIKLHRQRSSSCSRQTSPGRVNNFPAGLSLTVEEFRVE